ncbi:MAG: ImmA/IrrE family metallo-endopeptidase [Terracidiphilus sp.]
MKWVTDRTGRFRRRPHYDPEVIDFQCERLIQKFLMKKYGKIEYPVRTEDITVLIEERADLDSCVDLSHEEGEVDGVTEFRPGQRPLVSISDRLSASHMENRLRTTLTHEFGHVYFHQFMFETQNQTGALFPEETKGYTNKCNRGSIVGASETDWMEWQAGYVCGSILMPITAMVETVQVFRANNMLPFTNLTVRSDAGQKLIELVASTFQTSKDAARVRLLKKNILTERLVPSAELF